MVSFKPVDQVMADFPKVLNEVSTAIASSKEVAREYYEIGPGPTKEETEGADTLLAVGKAFAEIETDMKLFANAVKSAKREAIEFDPRGSEVKDMALACLERHYQAMIDGHASSSTAKGKKRKRRTGEEETDDCIPPPPSESHPGYVSLAKYIEQRQALLGAVGAPASEEVAEEDEEMTEDVAEQEGEVNTKCPYSGHQMVYPMVNCHCRHNYDRDPILEYIKKKGTKARCPVSGCISSRVLKKTDLSPNDELRAYIESKNREQNQ